MKRLLLTSASLLALLAAAPTASATTFLFSGAIVDFTIPVAGTYQNYRLWGSGRRQRNRDVASVHGGGGAEIRGDFVLTKGESVGDRGRRLWGREHGAVQRRGGGGGSFVIGPGNKPLVIAGGGGGAGGGVPYNVAHEGGYGGQTCTDGE